MILTDSAKTTTPTPIEKTDGQCTPEQWRIERRSVERRPIESDAWYSIRDISDKESPWYLFSSATVFRALRSGALKANYVGKSVRLRGAAILSLLGEGK